MITSGPLSPKFICEAFVVSEKVGDTGREVSWAAFMFASEDAAVNERIERGPGMVVARKARLQNELRRPVWQSVP